MDYANELTHHFETKHDVCQQYSAFRWTKKIIESCHNSYHLECAIVLIDLFRNKYKNINLVDELEAILDRRKIMILIP